MFDWLGKEKRKTYRVKSEGNNSFEVTLLASDGKKYCCEPIDISINGAAVSLPGEEPSLQSGDRVGLEILLLASGKIILAPAEIRGIETETHHRVIRFKFSNPDKIAENLDSREFKIINRRRHYRIEPIEPSHIKVTVGWEGNTAEGWIIDISISGIGLGVTAETARKIGRPDRMRLRFSLPGVKDKMQLAGMIQFRKSVGNNFLYGIQFDLNPYGEDGRYEKAISAFILKQQQITLQNRYQNKYKE